MTQTESKPTFDNEQGQAPQTDQNTPPYFQQFEDDTIDVYELWITLWTTLVRITCHVWIAFQEVIHK